MKKPMQRDWLQESLDIANGAKIPVRKEHVKTMVYHWSELLKKTEKINELMKKVYEQSVAKRTEQGLSVPPFGSK